MLEIYQYRQALELIKNAKSIVLAIHEGPDGDAWGSLSAFGLFLDRLGKSWQALGHEVLSDQYGYLSGLARTAVTKEGLALAQADLFISLDCGSQVRTGLLEEIRSRAEGVKFIEFDHHPFVAEKADLALRDSGASSTAEVLYDFFSANNLEIDPDMATALLTGLAADTGNFVYSATCQKTMDAAANLLARGGRLDRVFSATGKTKSFGGMKLWGLAMSRLSLNRHLGIAHTYLSAEDFVRIGAEAKEIDDLAGFLSGMSEAPVFMLIKESEPGLLKVSLRSNSDSRDVGALARIFGGGGHARAASFAVNLRLSDIVN